MRRGEIWWANLPAPFGSEPGNRRPVLILQGDLFNQSRLKTVIVAAITSNLLLAKFPGNILLPEMQSGLKKDSVVNLTQIITLDRLRLTEKSGRMPAALMPQLNENLLLVLGLS